ncbi:uncharacterized protein LOC111263813 [Varroa jacobsoni]|uniref:uncharacterized protein LOC111263813 n=1 Tax=Varroa jacobsoni TaxID=62625 RepID=UPI000BF5B5F3|nr:uncharacterized protein LOC111263813 [Varroa jacobsoni]
MTPPTGKRKKRFRWDPCKVAYQQQRHFFVRPLRHMAPYERTSRIVFSKKLVQSSYPHCKSRRYPEIAFRLIVASLSTSSFTSSVSQQQSSSRKTSEDTLNSVSLKVRLPPLWNDLQQFNC